MGPNPTDHGKPGFKYHLVVDRGGIPLAVRRIARRGIDSSERLGQYRWVVERTQAWLLGYRRLGVRYER